MAKRRGRGEGTIEELPSGRFRAALTVRTIGGGARKDRISETFDTRTQAAEWLAEQRTKFKYGKLAVTTATLGEYLDGWIRRRTPTVQRQTARSYAYHVGRLKGFPLAREALRKITRQLIEQAVPDWGSADEQRKGLQTLRLVLTDAVDDGLIPANPARSVRPPKAPPKLRLSYWTADEARRVLAAADGSWLAALFWLALDGGFRPGELLGLHWPEVDLAAGTVRVVQALEDVGGDLRLKEPKTAKGRRTVRIGLGARDALALHRERMTAQRLNVTTGPVFVGRRTKGLVTYSTFFHRYYRPVVVRAGVPKIRPYDMRHTCATLLLAAGVNIKVVSERLGHEQISTTLTHYAHLLPDAQEAAALAADQILRPGGRSATPDIQSGQAQQ
ncbi:MAG TPA: site-specific integrase [bacterium]|nr:site-specific integrase [bacterium]